MSIGSVARVRSGLSSDSSPEGEEVRTPDRRDRDGGRVERVNGVRSAALALDSSSSSSPPHQRPGHSNHSTSTSYPVSTRQLEHSPVVAPDAENGGAEGERHSFPSTPRGLSVKSASPGIKSSSPPLSERVERHFGATPSQTSMGTGGLGTGSKASDYALQKVQITSFIRHILEQYRYGLGLELGFREDLSTTCLLKRMLEKLLKAAFDTRIFGKPPGLGCKFWLNSFRMLTMQRRPK
jgi:hypothetical protein